MTLGKHQDEATIAPDSAKDDDTLDIVRLLIETETRHAETHPERLGEAHGEARGDAGESSAAASIAPRRVTLRGKPKMLRARPEGDPDEDEAMTWVGSDGTSEDLRPSRFGLKLPRLTRLKQIRRKVARFKAPSGKRKFEKDQMMRYAKLTGLTALALVVLFKPWLIPLILFMLAWLALIVFLLLGSARISEILESAWLWYQGKRPEKAQKIMERLQCAADRVDGILARLPERFSDGIYTPDLGRSARDMALENVQLPQDDPFERLALRRAPAE